MKSYRYDLAAIFGCVIIFVGLCLIYIPAAVIFVGVVILAGSVAAASAEESADGTVDKTIRRDARES